MTPTQKARALAAARRKAHRKAQEAPFEWRDDDKAANCATCRMLMLAQPLADDDLRRLAPDCPATVAGRITGRAFCRGCLQISGAGVSGLAGGMATDFGSPSPWHENATRASEDR